MNSQYFQDMVSPGGIIANIGINGVKVDLHLELLWSQNIAITTRLLDIVTTPMLLKQCSRRKSTRPDRSRIISPWTRYSTPTRRSNTPRRPMR